MRPTVGVYLDGVYRKTQGAIFDVVDLEELNPKGATRNTLRTKYLGGAINLITKNLMDRG